HPVTVSDVNTSIFKLPRHFDNMAWTRRNMIPDREKLIDDLFAQAVGLADERRAVFFEQLEAQNDAALIAELKALVSGFETAEAEGFLDQPLVRPEPADARPQMPASGQDLEGYRLVRLLGE